MRVGDVEREGSDDNVDGNGDAADGFDDGDFEDEEDAQETYAGRRGGRRQWLWARTRYYVPVVGWLPTYSARQSLAGDACAGVTVACLLVPQALSYSQAIVKVAPLHGLATCLLPLAVYAVLGSSARLAVGPEALVAILTASSLADADAHADAHADADARAAAAASLGLLVGLFTFALGFFRLGFLDSVLSRALLRGFVTAVAAVVVIDQTPALLRLDLARIPSPAGQPHVSPFDQLLLVLENLDKAHLSSSLVSAASIVFLFSCRFLKASNLRVAPYLRVVPEILLLVVATTLCSAFWRWDLLGIDILKDIEGGFPTPQIPKLTVVQIRDQTLSAVLISVIGFVESLVIAKTYATKYNQSVSPNRELVALGAANIAGACFSGWPAFGSLSRSAINDAAGAHTQISGFVSAIVVLLTMIYLLPYFYYLPKAVCSAIIVVAATRLVEMHDVHFLLRMRAWNDFGLLVLTFVATVFVSVEFGTLVSVGTSLLLVLKHTTKTRIVILGKVSSDAGAVAGGSSGGASGGSGSMTIKPKFRPLGEDDSVMPVDGCLIIRLEEGLFFGNSGQLKDRLKRIEVHGTLNVHPGEIPQRIVVSAPATAAQSDGEQQQKNGRLNHQQKHQKQQLQPLQKSNRNSKRHVSDEEEALLAEYNAPSSSNIPVASIPSIPETPPILPIPPTILSTATRKVALSREITCVIFDFSSVSAVDPGATQILLEIVQSYHRRAITVFFVKLRKVCIEMFRRAGILALIGPNSLFDKISDAVEYHLRSSGQLHVVFADTVLKHQIHDDDNGPPVLRFAAGGVEESSSDDEEEYVHPRRVHTPVTATAAAVLVGSWGSDAVDSRGAFTARTIANAGGSTITATKTASRFARPSFVTALEQSLENGFADGEGGAGGGGGGGGFRRRLRVSPNGVTAVGDFVERNDGGDDDEDEGGDGVDGAVGGGVRRGVSFEYSEEELQEYRSDNVWD